MVDSLSADLQIKVQFSEKRQHEKHTLLSMFPDVGIDLPNVEDYPSNSHTSTRMQIKQVISKELSIQSDLQACIDKLMQQKETLAEKVERTVMKKQTELNAITQLVQFISQAH